MARVPALSENYRVIGGVFLEAVVLRKAAAGAYGRMTATKQTALATDSGMI